MTRLQPIKVEGPALISFSGGRTSALMLRLCLDAGLDDDVHVVFANTGKEREETLAFVQACSDHWGVQIAWVEYNPAADDLTVEVDFKTASRKGEPFESLIIKRSFLPNPVSRFCTTELKIRRMKHWMLRRGYDHWTNIVGMRADEPERVARMRAPTKEQWDNDCPLARLGITAADVAEFWRAQPFDLQLRSWEGNCDLCFLKGGGKRLRIIQDTPERAAWWAAMESRTGATFRADTPSYARLAEFGWRQLRMPFDDAAACDADGADIGDCVCHE